MCRLQRSGRRPTFTWCVYYVRQDAQWQSEHVVVSLGNLSRKQKVVQYNSREGLFCACASQTKPMIYTLSGSFYSFLDRKHTKILEIKQTEDTEMESSTAHTHTRTPSLHMHYPSCTSKDSSSVRFTARSALFREQTARLQEPARGKTAGGGLETWNQPVVEVTALTRGHATYMHACMHACLCVFPCVCERVEFFLN